MKLLPSPSISSTTPFDTNICTSKPSTASCFASILRRLLCAPAHPSDHISDASSSSIPFQTKQLHFAIDVPATSTNPGIVARLMGLHSLPHNANPTSIPRSRSMNSAEFFRDDESDSKHGQRHRLAKSSLSFCETPTFFELENEEFFVLSFEKTGDTRKGKKARERYQSEEYRMEVHQVILQKKKKKKKDEEVTNKEQLSNGISDTCCNIQDSTKAASVFEENWKNKKLNPNPCSLKIEEGHEECSSQDSSPVSVLEFHPFVVHHPLPTSEKEAISRRKLSSRFHRLSETIDNHFIGDNQNSKKNEETCGGAEKKVCHPEEYFNKWGDICRVAESQALESKWQSEHVEEISRDFGLQILDHLLEELVDQLIASH